MAKAPLLVLAFCCLAIAYGKNTFLQVSKFVGVGTDNNVYMRHDLSDAYSWIKLPNSCCVTQIHFMRNGYMLGVGLDKNVWVKKSIYGTWSMLSNSCCVTEV